MNRRNKRNGNLHIRISDETKSDLEYLSSHHNVTYASLIEMLVSKEVDRLKRGFGTHFKDWSGS